MDMIRIPVHPCALFHSSTIQWYNIPGPEGEQQWAPTTVAGDGIGNGRVSVYFNPLNITDGGLLIIQRCAGIARPKEKF